MRKFLAVFFFFLSATCFADQDEIVTARITGDIGQVILPLSALTFSFTGDNPALTNQFAKSLGTTLGIAYALKVAVNEKRPNGGDHSFPSGHTSSAFAGASFIQTTYGWKYGGPAYAAASYVGWSRVESKSHWAHDVAAGALLGITVNYFYAQKPRKKSPVIFRIQPALSERGNFGIGALYLW